jgi:hypothetical protein
MSLTASSRRLNLIAGVSALGGLPNKAQGGVMGVDGPVGNWATEAVCPGSQWLLPARHLHRR